MAHKNRNYTNYSKPQTTLVKPVVEAIEEPVVEPVVETIEETVSEPTQTLGVVNNYMKLNVREEANAEANVLCVIKLADEVMVIKEESTDEFYKVVTGAGVEGFCMKKFINVN